MKMCARACAQNLARSRMSGKFPNRMKIFVSQYGWEFFADRFYSLKILRRPNFVEVETVSRFVRGEMEAYRLYTVVPKLVAFLESLTNWYSRL